ncbi:MAG: hypothetical protein CRN43_07515 [Candidatus Nephrothrix sp. EaCA]|nr:MAG: hypothetical protein CRN43_07515 [Candidatus Nephrothrix sp. EaCA]
MRVLKKQDYAVMAMVALVAALFSGCKDKTVTKKDPVITWANPSDIRVGVPLSVTQLNATADVQGTFVYTPPAETRLKEGANQELKVDFTPSDAANYNSASKTVKINVKPAIAIYKDVEFSLTPGSITYGRYFSCDDGKIYKDSEINATTGPKIHLAFGSIEHTIYYFQSPTHKDYKVPGATPTKVSNYTRPSPISVADFDAMTDDSKLSPLTIRDTNEAFGNTPATAGNIVLFELASGRKGAIRTKAVDNVRLLVDIKVQN